MGGGAWSHPKTQAKNVARGIAYAFEFLYIKGRGPCVETPSELRNQRSKVHTYVEFRAVPGVCHIRSTILAWYNCTGVQFYSIKQMYNTSTGTRCSNYRYSDYSVMDETLSLAHQWTQPPSGIDGVQSVQFKFIDVEESMEIRMARR